ncbi:hypothetical protein PIB30_067851 [Stylosanthes scabra]|uniref:Uncharacterized protein n=1 Tax=Stylosanthes scabra TaxID=79078 RepID=A0ABU6QMP2_9FABA|nr:hypothetical protein [Stylosanthes scabra]
MSDAPTSINAFRSSSSFELPEVGQPRGCTAPTRGCAMQLGPKTLRTRARADAHSKARGRELVAELRLRATNASARPHMGTARKRAVLARSQLERASA